MWIQEEQQHAGVSDNSSHGVQYHEHGLVPENIFLIFPRHEDFVVFLPSGRDFEKFGDVLEVITHFSEFYKILDPLWMRLHTVGKHIERVRLSWLAIHKSDSHSN